MGTTHRAGSFAVPASTGNVTIPVTDGPTEIPHTIIFFGSNQQTEDTVLSPSLPAIFMGLAARQAGGSWLMRVNAFRHNLGYTTRSSRCIYSIVDASINAEYQATIVSSTAGSFTLNFSQVAANRFVHYLAICDSAGYDAINNDVFAGTGSSTTLEAFQALSGFNLGGYAYDGGGADYTASGYIAVFQGAMSYPATYAFGKGDASSLSISDFNTNGQRFVKLYEQFNAAGPWVSVGPAFIGPFLNEVNHTAYLTDATHFHSDVAGFGDSGLFACWTGDSEPGTGTPSGSVAGISHQVLSRQAIPDVVLVFGANGTEAGPGIGSAHKAAFFGVWTDTYQGCVGITDAGYLYQSRNKSWVAAIASGLVCAGTIQRDTPGFDFVTSVAGTPPQDTVWWAAANDIDEDIPQIFRRPHG